MVCEIHNKPWIEDGRGCLDCIDETHAQEVERLKNEIRDLKHTGGGGE